MPAWFYPTFGTLAALAFGWCVLCARLIPVLAAILGAICAFSLVKGEK